MASFQFRSTFFMFLLEQTRAIAQQQSDLLAQHMIGQVELGSDQIAHARLLRDAASQVAVRYTDRLTQAIVLEPTPEPRQNGEPTQYILDQTLLRFAVSTERLRQFVLDDDERRTMVRSIRALSGLLTTPSFTALQQEAIDGLYIAVNLDDENVAGATVTIERQTPRHPRYLDHR